MRRGAYAHAFAGKGEAPLSEVHNLMHARASAANIECSHRGATGTLPTARVNTYMRPPQLIIELYRITVCKASR